MPNATVDASSEARLMFACPLINQLKEDGLLTDALVAAATSFQDLKDDIAAGIEVSGTDNDKYGPEVRTKVRYLLAELQFLNSIGQLEDADVTSLTTVNTASAGTDLRYRFSNLITASGFDAALSDFVDGAFGAVSYTDNLT